MENPSKEYTKLISEFLKAQNEENTAQYDDNQNAFDTEELERNEIHLCFFHSNEKLAAAYYDLDRQIICYLNEISETSPKFELASLIIKDTQPTKILTGTPSTENFQNFLENLCKDTEEKYILLPQADFNYENSRKKILELKIDEKRQFLTENDRLLFFHTMLDFDKHLTIRCIGALLKYLQRKRINIQLEDMAAVSPIKAIKSMQLADILYIDDNSLKSLQIFHKISHPSVYKQQSSKEGLSLFNLYSSKIQSKLGNAKLRSWLLKPTRNFGELKKRHNCIEFFLDASNIDISDKIQICIHNIRNTKLIFRRIKTSEPRYTDWLALFKTTENLLKLYSILNNITKFTENNRRDSSLLAFSTSTIINCKDDAGFFEEFIQMANEEHIKNVHEVYKGLTHVIDFKEMSESKKFIVKKGIDRELDFKKSFYRNLAEFLQQLGQEELRRLQLESCSAVYMPQLGFLLALDCDCLPEIKSQRAQFEFVNSFRLVFEADGKVYYKNGVMMDLDERYGDLVTDINNIELKIMSELQAHVEPHAVAYANLTEICSEIDVCIAFALTANERNYCKPVFNGNFGDTMSSEAFVQAELTRHPLLESVVDSFVPNDVCIGSGGGGLNSSDCARVKLFTGPNACGKTVYMKQVALMVYMAFIGSFVPAKKANFGDFDRIFTRINSYDSVSTGLSTFASDLKQIGEILNNYTAKSLMLVDEFGKGTLDSDGKALFGAFVRYLLAHEEKIPCALVSTHFHELFRGNDLLGVNSNVNLQFLSFNYLCEGDKGESVSQQLTFLYTLKPNSIANLSFAINIARAAGIDKGIIDRATEIYNAMQRGENVFLMETEHSEFEIQRATNTVTSFLEILADVDEESGNEIDVNEIAAKMKKLFWSIVEEPKTPKVGNNAENVEQFDKMDCFKDVFEAESNQSKSQDNLEESQELF